MNPIFATTEWTYLIVTDYLNLLIRKIVISTVVVTTLAGRGSSGSTNATVTAAKLNFTTIKTSDGTSLYVTDRGNHLIRQIEWINVKNCYTTSKKQRGADHD